MSGPSTLNVLYASLYSSYRMGGQKSLVLALAHVDRGKITPYVLLSDPGELQGVLSGINCPSFVIPQPSPHRRYLWKPASSEAKAWYLCVKRISNLIRNLNIHVIHAETPEQVITCKVAAMVSLRVDVRVVFYARLAGSHRLDRWVERCTDGIVAVSHDAAHRFRQASKDTNRVQTVYNAVDLDRFRPVSDRAVVRKGLNLPEKGFLVCFVGQLTTAKGLFDLIHAWGRFMKHADNTEARLLVIGDPMEDDIQERIRGVAKDQGVWNSIQLVSHREDIERWMQASNVLVLPSHEGAEGMGRVVAEAMACGTVPVVSNISGVREVITSAEGIFVPERNPAALAKVLHSLAKDTTICERLARNGPARVYKLFAPERQARALESFYFNIPG